MIRGLGVSGLTHSTQKIGAGLVESIDSAAHGCG